MNPDWKAFYRNTKDAPPSPLLVKALAYVRPGGKAIDIGGGALKDTRYLLAQGFDVTVIDKEETLMDKTEAIGSEKLHAHVSAFAEFDFPKGEYDLASAMYALPFNPPETFDSTFENVQGSLAPGGIFCGQFFGVKDQWRDDSRMTFHTKEQVEKLLEGMDTISFDEHEWDGKLADGSSKHWHVFEVIARKP